MVASRFFVHVDYPNRWATIHLHGCRHARDHLSGNTKAFSKRTWLGPFGTLDGAVDAARQARHGLFIDGCKDCKPHQEIKTARTEAAE